MPKLSEAVWQGVERDYFRGRETLAVIAERHGTSPGAIHDRRIKLGWPRYRDVTAAVAAAGPTIDKAALIARFYSLINLKLEQMEEDMARSTERTPADNERETRALGTLIRNFEKVFGLEQESSGNDDKRNSGEPERPAEAEAIRRELAERLVRLRKTEPEDGA